MRALFLPPTFADEGRSHAARLLYPMSLTTLLGALVFTPLFLLLPRAIQNQFLWPTAGLACVSLGALYLVRRGQVRTASGLMVGAYWLFFTALAAINNGVRSPAFMGGHLMVIVLAGLLLGERGGIAVTVLSVFAGAGLLLAGISQRASVFSPEVVWLISGTFFFIVTVAQYLSARTVRETLARAQASEARYRGLLENTPAITYIKGLGADAPILYLSPQAEAALGYSTQAFLNKPLFLMNTISAEDREHVLAEYELSRRGGGPFRRDYRLLTASGETRWVHDEAVLVRNEAGQPDYWLGVWTDITERKQAEAALRYSEEIHRRAIAAAGAVPYYRDHRAEQFTFMGEGIVDLCGYTAAEITPDLWSQLTQESIMHGEAEGLSLEQAFALARAGQLREWRSDSRIRTRAGQERWVSDTSIEILDEAGQSIGSFGILMDVTERIAAHTALRESEALYRQAIVAAGAVPYFQDYATQSYLFMGEGIRRFTGYRPEEITPALWEKLSLEAHLTGEGAQYEWAEAIRRARAGELRIWQCDYRVRARDGQERWIADASVEVVNERGVSRGSIGILQDVTERRRAVNEARRLNAELEARVVQRTEQLQAANRELEAFAYSVSHDLRAPLRAIDGFSRAVQEDYAGRLDAAGMHALIRIREGAQRMGQLIDDLLRFSRLGRQALEVVSFSGADLARLVEEVVRDVRAEAPDRAVAVSLAALPPCQADPALLKQVWVNLLANAFKFTRGQAAARIEVGCHITPEGEAAYFVRDNGAGFDMAYVQKLFGVFQRLHGTDEFEGTGVGLAIVNRVVQRHGGRVWAESAPGHGAIFYFTLPSA